MPDLVDIKTAAKKLGVSTRSIRNYIAAGKLPAYYVAGHLVRIDVDDLKKLLTRVVE